MLEALSGLQLYEKITPPAQVLFSEFCKIFKSAFFTENLRMTVSQMIMRFALNRQF